jgi:hypothetical protein
MGVADRSQHGRKIHTEYSFDRLSEKKIIQAYRALIPDKIWMTGHESQGLRQAEEIIRDEASGDLCPSLLRATEDG